ncbi:hypothetical protein LXA43DRAFT_1069364 [Ganoderma leucocontextum]|nr:hypothetical protein LXA43DRAFT_1069364 [Ganoderma leucocontextum]
MWHLNARSKPPIANTLSSTTSSSSAMGVFEPDSVRQQCAATIDDKKARLKFITTWKKNVECQAKGWAQHRDSQSKHFLLLLWHADIAEYLTATANAICSSQGSDLSVALDPRWPLIGPLFEPPSYLHQILREVTPQIEPDITYLKVCYVVHWIFHDVLRRCPKCHSRRLERNGWNPSGPREVHGLFCEETALGIQLRCLDCAAKYAKQGQPAERKDGRYCWTTTSAEFWEDFEHWELPIGLPHFYSRSAVTSELFDFIVEMRLKSTSAGLAENVKQLHLLEYHKQHILYLQAFRARTQQMVFSKQTKPLVLYSKPLSKKVAQQTGGYDNRSISDDLITMILLRFSNKTRIEESEEHMRTLSAVAISVDTTFRCAYKATLVDKNKARVRSHLGGFVSVLNQKSQPISWRLCHSQSQVETQEMLSGLSTRLDCLELPHPEILTADNCCQVRNSAQKVFPNINVVQDVWHLLMRYLAEVANDIVDALLKAKAANGVPAVYRPQAEQEERLAEAYNKWKEHGGVWTAAATKVHEKQLSHVQKGCLARPRNDIATDGSRIEGSHKGWNSIMRAFPSGLEVMNALGHDHVLRHNVRLDMQDDTLDQSMFMYHTHGSHHIHLTNACMKLWNTLVEAQRRSGPLPANVRALPELHPGDSGEKFGLVKMSAETATQYSLATIKQEPGDATLDLSSQEMLDPDRILEEIGVDPALLKAPVPESAALHNTPVSKSAALHSAPASVSESAPNAPASVSESASAPNADLKGKGVKRACEEDSQDDEIIELSRAEWGLPAKWFPAAQPTTSTLQAAFASTSMNMTSSDATIAMSSSGVTPSNVSTVLLPSMLTTTPSAASTIPASTVLTSAHTALSDTSAVPASGALATVGQASSAPAIAVSPASTIMAPGAPAIAASNMLLIGTSSGTLATTSTNASLSAPSAPPVLDGAPPKKKVCLNVPGMPPPMKTRQQGSNQDISRSTMTARTNRGTLDAIFAQMSTATATTPHAASLDPTPTNEPCLPTPAIVGLTRSQRLFSVVTQVDPRALTFNKGGSSREFFLFMKLRVIHGWAMFQMTPYDWVCAASTYNTAIKDLNREQGTALPLKTPRALLDKLSEVEVQIFSRIRDGNYCSRSNQTDFWEYHCKAVYLGSKIQRMVDDETFKMGKNHICGWCKRIMYPEGKNHKDNHSRNVCSDGVRQSPEKVHLVINGISRDFIEQVPPFPQPKDVFTDGNVFHPLRFMEVVRRFYDRVIINHSAPGVLAMNDYAFAGLLYDRTVIVPGLDGRPSKVIFKLFHSFKLAPGEAAVLDDHEGEMYLRMDCLSEPPLEMMQDAATAVGGVGAPEGAGLA